MPKNVSIPRTVMMPLSMPITVILLRSSWLLRPRRAMRSPGPAGKRRWRLLRTCRPAPQAPFRSARRYREHPGDEGRACVPARPCLQPCCAAATDRRACWTPEPADADHADAGDAIRPNNAGRPEPDQDRYAWTPIDRESV